MRHLVVWLDNASGGEGWRSALASTCLSLVVAIVIWCAAAQLIAASMLVAGMRLSGWTGVVALGIAVLAGGWTHSLQSPGSPKSTRFVLFGVLAVVIGLAIALASSLYDLSFDGNATYQVAILKLAGGWNPYFSDAGSTLPLGAEPWIDAYPKGSWLQGAVLHLVGVRLEAAKAINLLLVAATAMLWWCVASEIAPERTGLAAVVAMVVALNPVAVTQAFTFMYDGQIASLLSIWLGLAALLWTRRGSWPVLVALASATALLANVKFTALVYVVMLSVALGVTALLRSPSLVRPRAVVLALALALLLGVGFIGFNPYVTNSVNHGSPFYPLAGPDAQQDFMVGSMPGNFAGMNRFERLAHSVFSRAADVEVTGPGTSTQLKLPLTVSYSELRAFLGSTTRASGFGPLFGAVVLLALGLLAGLLLDRRTRGDGLVQALLAACAVILATVFVNPEMWWARYVPQLWLVPVGIAVAAVLRGGTLLARRVGLAVFALMLCNIAIVSSVNLASQVKGTMTISRALDRVAELPSPVRIEIGQYAVDWVKLEDRGVPYRIVAPGSQSDSGTVVPYLTLVIHGTE